MESTQEAIASIELIIMQDKSNEEFDRGLEISE